MALTTKYHLDKIAGLCYNSAVNIRAGEAAFTVPTN